ncbi:MAG: hypothetical protein M1118_01225 [Chloroflexi bacterium]|nr:hypothetical protein [Chloroflexota bacterium]
MTLSPSQLQPLLLIPERVHRVYRGGALLERLLGLPTPADGDQPEAWFGAINSARQTGLAPVIEGIGSVLLPEGWSVAGRSAGQALSMPALLLEHADSMLGPGHVQFYGQTTAVLLKVLDAAERLTVQIHPNQAFAQEHLDSAFGKDEAWVVLDVRSIDGEEPALYFGLRESIEPETFVRWAEEGRVDLFLERMHRLLAHPGDVIYVLAGTLHAIGPGLLIAEVQEPTDFTFSFDRIFGGQVLTDERRFLGLSPRVALSAARITAFTEWQLMHLFRARGNRDGRPAPLRTQVSRPVGNGGNDRFWIEIVSVGPHDEVASAPTSTLAVGVVIAGAGTLAGTNGRELSVHQGDGFLIPATLGEWRVNSGGAGLRLVVCGPQPASVAAARTQAGVIV